MTRLGKIGLAAILGATLGSIGPALAQAPAAQLILRNGHVWTVDPGRPEAQAVAVAGNRIVAVGSNREISRYEGLATRVVDLHGALVLPGFVDTHTHFGNAVDAFFTARVIDVEDDERLSERLRGAVERVPKGMWITAADLQGEAAAKAKRGNDGAFDLYAPSLAALDAAAPDHPVLIRRFDGTYFGNSAVLALAQLGPGMPDPPNGEYVRDASGRFTGELRGSAGTRIAAMMPPRSKARDAIAAAALVKSLNQLGIVGIHDIARIDAVSQRQIYQVDVERSFTNMQLFYDLRSAGRLTLRVNPLLALAPWRDYAALGITAGSGDDLIRYTALKVLLDSSFMFRPFANRPAWSGGLSYRVADLDRLRGDIVGADALGFDIGVHVTGDRGLQIVLDDFAAAEAANRRTDRRFRLIHLWYPSEEQVRRAGAAHYFADIQPYQLISQLKSIDAALGPDRARSAFPWRAAADAGVTLDLGSDWPGSYDGIEIAPNNPLEQIYYAVTRRDLSGAPAGGWHPEQALSIRQAIEAYTINAARASRQEQARGTISKGKLADIVVLSEDIMNAPPERLLTTRLLYTIFDGRIVYEAGDERRR